MVLDRLQTIDTGSGHIHDGRFRNHRMLTLLARRRYMQASRRARGQRVGTTEQRHT